MVLNIMEGYPIIKANPTLLYFENVLLQAKFKFPASLTLQRMLALRFGFLIQFRRTMDWPDCRKRDVS